MTRRHAVEYAALIVHTLHRRLVGRTRNVLVHGRNRVRNGRPMTARCRHPFTREDAGRIKCVPCGADRTPRRHTLDGCAGCEPRGMRPSHDASPNCTSGGHIHCSCSGCF